MEHFHFPEPGLSFFTVSKCQENVYICRRWKNTNMKMSRSNSQLLATSVFCLQNFGAKNATAGVAPRNPCRVKRFQEKKFCNTKFFTWHDCGAFGGLSTCQAPCGDGDELLWSFKAGQHIWAPQAHHKQQKMWTPCSKRRDVFCVHFFKLTQNHSQNYLQCVQYSSSVIESVVTTHVTRPNEI